MWSWSDTATPGIPVGQAAERIGDRLARVVFVDSNVPADGESFVSGWPDGRAAVEATVADHGGFWPPPAAADCADQGLDDEQIARMLMRRDTAPRRHTHRTGGAEAPVEPACRATYVKCLLDWPEPSPAVAGLLTSDRWELVTLDTGHWPMFSRPRELARILLDVVEKDA